MKIKSIYKQFYTKLIIATSFFLIILSFIFYEYAKSSFYSNIEKNLLKQAKHIEKSYISFDKFKNIFNETQKIEVVFLENNQKDIKFIKFFQDDKTFAKLIFPMNDDAFLQITKDITLERDILNSIIFKNFFSLAIPGFILMLIYSLVVAKSLLKPIVEINKKLSNMDENSLSQIDTKNLPTEFTTLANSINSLTNRIGTYLKFKKELYIGIAHELKTPLAVMKLKNELMLKKPREKSEYEDAIKLTISEINSMNIMISSILDIGRTEGAQFEQSKNIELVSFINKKVEDYKMLALKKEINMRFITNTSSFELNIQETLFMQILQNFVQNAIKFTPNGKNIEVYFKKIDNTIILSVVDEGVGIDEKIDVFAPFKKVGDKSGVGLGLYLAKIAADALNAEISIKNRSDGKSGAIAKFELKLITIED
ncbi:MULTISPECIES: sensor histidine kinase [Aliarcobacter]|jgi:two-component system OmpR family sensor kinase|uniref:histidine kinase n=3 Tax=Aliarcobacter skirrowii TaxID=28200 RepID=A0AAD0WMW7_9BACT|nr:HAMP domain-containing sensor histidine kinase [Aliarcobacter skirrowii]AXX84191.1 two-component system sensor histidine kinase [Aliarcobacter skirrowii CCUG 10374]KAB0621625.1 HAMP domain-containing histidine kinase [Aliarcobacter skirrowii CCUG 10374]MDX4061108.1 HAMP domain-containing sensor histidine kinase [Aliarcobacter skirrowii]MDX4068493.1 HAMP domain-containing sensor histidine kinase [Aliarcobacter skirrowii]RXI26878.1 sensor histidine kinase [Aliarcobacter skirrowii CCUG 10374]